MKSQFLKLTLVTNKKDCLVDDYLDFVVTCAKSGITAVQLREKNLCYADLFEFGSRLQSLLKPLRIPLIINDNVELAHQLNADGVHLGQSDCNPVKARQLLGNEKIIGLTVDSQEQLSIANDLPLDYIGIGALFPTNNKHNITTLWGCGGLRQVATLTKHPIIAIGGINETNAQEVMQAGAHGIAAIDAFHQAQNPTTTIKNLLRIVLGT